MQIEALYHDHGAGLLRYLERVFGMWAAPEDLLQETFVEALGCAERCLAADSPRAFLFGIARNVGLSARRRRRTRRMEPLGNVEPEAAVATDSMEMAEMRAAIGRLEEPVRETLELRLRDELSYEEIALVLGIPMGTVRSRLHTAVKTLRARMRD
jgi:RNA polymerase sigma-70 factor (ECF subfamily)